jgi:saccharopine dehydrogenase-like NADP-dependent oxidoreductase
MKILALGGAGKICSEAVRDLAEFGDVRKLTVADADGAAARRLAEELNDERIGALSIDLRDPEAAVLKMRGYDVVMDGTPIRLNDLSTRCIAEAGCHGINLNGFGEEYEYDALFRKQKKTHVPGFGMTPGVTDMMVRHAADQLETVDTVRVSHGAFRPIAFSPSIAETTIYEYDPDLPGRVVFEDGRFVQVPPFSGERVISLPEPYGAHPQWIIPHAETRTAHAYLKDKGVRRIEVRGTWPPANMQLVRTLYDWGFFRNDRVRLGDAEFGIMDAVGAYLQQAPEGNTTGLFGYALHVEVVGARGGKRIRYVLTHTHPASDGSVEGWEGLRAYTRCVGIPLAVGTRLIASGKVAGIGVVMPEFAFRPADVFSALEKRKILIHVEVRDEEDR